MPTTLPRPHHRRRVSNKPIAPFIIFITTTLLIVVAGFCVARANQTNARAFPADAEELTLYGLGY